jgi:glycosyltransferase involved in cell wall biosynthesis
VKIGIDGNFFGISTGIGQYTSYLIDTLARLVSPDFEILLLLRHNYPSADLPSGCRIVRAPSANRLIWANLYAAWIIWRKGLDLYHALDNLSLPLFWPKGRTRYVITIHDIIPLLFPEGVRPRHRYYFRFAMRRIIQLADAIIVDSENTKSAILQHFNVSEEKLNVIYLGVDGSRFQPIDDQEYIKKVHKRYGIGPHPYILFVGNIEPRKNLSSLIHAFAELVQSGIFKPEIQLIIAGAQGPLAGDLLSLPSQLGLGDKVLFPGVIMDVDLPALYSGASLFVFPSHHEGFGFPVLEAMSCGTPVITSNVSSLPEIAGDAAILVDPNGVHDISEAMLKLLTNDMLREEMIQKGFDRARRFSWEETARQTLRVYERIFAAIG